MSPAAVRMSRAMAPAAPIRLKPAISSRVELVRVASAVTPQPAAPRANPPETTGMRPKRSIIRPAGTAVSPEAVRKIAGPSKPFTPVTRTNVSDDTAATSWRTTLLTASVAARMTVLRRIGRLDGPPVATKPIQYDRRDGLGSGPRDLVRLCDRALAPCRRGRARRSGERASHRGELVR